MSTFCYWTTKRSHFEVEPRLRSLEVTCDFWVTTLTLLKSFILSTRPPATASSFFTTERDAMMSHRLQKTMTSQMLKLDVKSVTRCKCLTREPSPSCISDAQTRTSLTCLSRFLSMLPSSIESTSQAETQSSTTSGSNEVTLNSIINSSCRSGEVALLTSSLAVVTGDRMRGMSELTEFKDARHDVIEECRKGSNRARALYISCFRYIYIAHC